MKSETRWYVLGGMSYEKSWYQRNLMRHLLREAKSLQYCILWNVRKNEFTHAVNKYDGLSDVVLLFSDEFLPSVNPSAKLLADKGRMFGIYTYRDIRDVCAVMVAHERKNHPWAHILLDLKKMVSDWSSWKDYSHCVLSLQFEQLDGPLNWLRHVAGYMKLPVTEAQLIRSVEKTRQLFKGSYLLSTSVQNWRNQVKDHAQTVASPGQFHNVLTSGQCFMVERIAGSWLRECGYETQFQNT